MGVPYAIVKNKSRLGRVARRKTCTCMAFTTVSTETLSLLPTRKRMINIRANPMNLGDYFLFPDFEEVSVTIPNNI
jgi:hypothetical protein